MANLKYDKEISALLLIDPYHDFISGRGKVWNRLKTGLIAHTRVEATVRFAAELGEVTMVNDATANYSDEEMHAALDINIPNYASAIVTTDEIVDSISALSTVGVGVGH
jgi:ureidoacrylate peracid hydrolase